MTLSKGEIYAADVVRRLLSSITLITCLLISLAIIIFQKYRFAQSRLVLWLSIVAFFQAIAYLMPYLDEAGESRMCDFQAFWMSFCDWSLALWICTLVMKVKNTIQYEKFYHIFVWGISLLVASLPFFEGVQVYGPAGAWCWIVKEEVGWRMGTWYGPLFFFFIYVGVMYVWCLKALYAEKSSDFYQREGEEELRNKWRVSMRLTRYPLIFIVLWVFPIINRIDNWVNNDDGHFWLVLLHTISITIQGTINSIVYCFDEEIFYQCTPSGIKTGINMLFSKKQRETVKIQKYAMRLEDADEFPNSDNKMQNVSLE